MNRRLDEKEESFTAHSQYGANRMRCLSMGNGFLIFGAQKPDRGAHDKGKKEIRECVDRLARDRTRPTAIAHNTTESRRGE